MPTTIPVRDAFERMERAPSSLLLLLLLSSLAVVCSAVEPVPIIGKPDVAPESLPINYIQEVGSCSYEVTIATSCSSPPFFTGEIGVLFGDSQGNQIIEKKLSNGDKVLGSCNTDSFVLKDRPCSVLISYMYIYKDGADDWLPNSVEISGAGIEPLFIFKVSIPRNTWFGFDLRQYPFPPPPSFNPAPPIPWFSTPPPPSHPLLPPPEPILPPPPERILPPPPEPILPPPPEPILPPPPEPILPPPPEPILPPPPERILPPPPEPILPPPPEPILPPPPEPILPPPPEPILPPPPEPILPPPPEPILPPPPEPILPPPPPPPKPVFPSPPPPTPPSSSSKISGQKWGMVSAILGLLAALL